MEKCNKPLIKLEEKSVWATVSGVAVEYIEAQENPVTKENIIQGVIDSGKASLIPFEKISELVEAMLILFVGNGILVNNNGTYTKRTVKDAFQGREIEIEFRGKRNGQKKKN